MFRMPCRRLLLALGCGMAALPATVAGAHDVQAGGASYGGRPHVGVMECVTGDRAGCPEGELLRVRGERLDEADAVIFLGRSGRSDDVRTAPDESSPHRVLVRVPAGARTGPVRVDSRDSGASRASRRRLQVKVATAAPRPAVAVPPGEGIFPVRGTHDFGTETNRFGGGRGHKGQDVFAACATPIVAARSGVVTLAKFQDRAGNYAVITADDGTSQAYMHMLEPSPLKARQPVAAGQPIGQVGETGRATGCHLHYESWSAPGWYHGGSAIDPMPELQAWAARG